MTLQALRHRIGEDAFWTLLRTWVGSSARTATAPSEEFEALAEQVSGQDLDRLLRGLAARADPHPAATAREPDSALSGQDGPMELPQRRQ